MKERLERGITLIALVVTIIVLLILAGVSIALVLGQDEIINKAEIAVKNTKESEELEQVSFAVLEAMSSHLVEGKDLKMELERLIPGAIIEANYEDGFTITLKNGYIYKVDQNGKVTKEESTTPLQIVDGVKIPEGFTHKAGKKREDGIVVADKDENEYVWIPVTKDEEGNPTEPYRAVNGMLNEKVIQLQRGDTNKYTEDTTESHDSRYGNAIAENITKFKESVAKNGGYFFGRYEAGIEGGTLTAKTNYENDPNWTGWENGTLVVKPGQQIWNYITQNKASQLCKNIDTEKGYKKLTSDLVNSYAWDTAIVFIETCGTESNSSNYANQIGQSRDSGGPFKTGEAILKSPEMLDKQCNIYDMAGNCYEWTTETYNDASNPCVERGGSHSGNSIKTNNRWHYSVVVGNNSIPFRSLLYWNS